MQRRTCALLNTCYSSASCPICLYLIRSLLQKLTFGMERFTAPPGFPLKRSARRRPWRRGRDFGAGCKIDPPPPLCVVWPRPVASSRLNRAALRRSPGCCNLLSARPDYRLLHIVWRRLQDGRGGRRRGEWEGWRRLRFVATRAPLPFY